MEGTGNLSLYESEAVLYNGTRSGIPPRKWLLNSGSLLMDFKALFSCDLFSSFGFSVVKVSSSMKLEGWPGERIKEKHAKPAIWQT